MVLLVLVAGISAFLYLRPAKQEQGAQTYELSARKLADFNNISVEYPTKAAVKYEKRDGYWYMTAPYQQRADQQQTQRILSILAAKSTEKFPATDLARFGLDNPRLKLKLNDEEFVFGTHNAITELQYVLHKGAVYALESTYEESATVQEIEMVDKRMLMPNQKAVGFDLSKLEQWEKSGLKLAFEQGKWVVTTPAGATPKQEEMRDWLDMTWNAPIATAVEIYQPNAREQHPSFEITLQDGKKIHVDKLQESPELLLARPDEGLIYHFPPDLGFTMLNPPAGVAKE